MAVPVATSPGWGALRDPRDETRRRKEWAPIRPSPGNQTPRPHRLARRACPAGLKLVNRCLEIPGTMRFPVADTQPHRVPTRGDAPGLARIAAKPKQTFPAPAARYGGSSFGEHKIICRSAGAAP